MRWPFDWILHVSDFAAAHLLDTQQRGIEQKAAHVMTWIDAFNRIANRIGHALALQRQRKLIDEPHEGTALVPENGLIELPV